MHIDDNCVWSTVCLFALVVSPLSSLSLYPSPSVSGIQILDLGLLNPPTGNCYYWLFLSVHLFSFFPSHCHHIHSKGNCWASLHYFKLEKISQTEQFLLFLLYLLALRWFYDKHMYERYCAKVSSCPSFLQSLLRKWEIGAVIYWKMWKSIFGMITVILHTAWTLLDELFCNFFMQSSCIASWRTFFFTV